MTASGSLPTRGVFLALIWTAENDVREGFFVTRRTPPTSSTFPLAFPLMPSRCFSNQLRVQVHWSFPHIQSRLIVFQIGMVVLFFFDGETSNKCLFLFFFCVVKQRRVGLSFLTWETVRFSSPLRPYHFPSASSSVGGHHAVVNSIYRHTNRRPEGMDKNTFLRISVLSEVRFRVRSFSIYFSLFPQISCAPPLDLFGMYKLGWPNY